MNTHNCYVPVEIPELPVEWKNVWDRPIYVPENTPPARAGAEDHLSIKSKGQGD